MSEDILPTRQPNPGEILLRNKFYENVCWSGRADEQSHWAATHA